MSSDRSKTGRPFIAGPISSDEPATARFDAQTADRTVLIVEDNPDIRRLLSVMLNGVDAKLNLLSDGHAMSEQIQHFSPPAVVILDRMLPGLSGDLLLKKIRDSATWKNVPVIVISALRRKFDVNEVLESGADMYIPKPLDRQVLVDAVTKYLN
ncbi:MAG: response regulator, partial [Burkholderiaceae bacterium]